MRLLFGLCMAFHQNRWPAARKWRGTGRVCWGDGIFEMLLIRAIRGFVNYVSHPMSDLPLTYQSELIYKALLSVVVVFVEFPRI